MKEQIKKELTESLKSGDQLKRLVLGTLLTAVKNKELNKRNQLSTNSDNSNELEKASQLSEEEIIEVVASEVKKRKDSIEQFKAGGRNDLAEKEAAEVKILMAYLPQQLSEEETRKEIEITINQLGLREQKETGKLIGAVMAKLKGRVDGGLVSRIAKELLQNS